MKMLRVDGSKIRDTDGKSISLRGPSLGGWMNLENFINGYPGHESGIRHAFTEELGKAKSDFFFERMAYYFLSAKDIRFIRDCGATVVRLPFNYRLFENDDQPFRYKEEGFRMLESAVSWCEVNGLYIILDLHATPGWQNSDWPSDNASRHSLLWSHIHFQDRVVELWKEIAKRYVSRATVAGYDIINEPLSGEPFGRFTPDSRVRSNWQILNRLYHRSVEAIREIDPDHIIFLEGDNFSKHFSGLEPPFAENVVYSSHHYIKAGLGPGRYPGRIDGEPWDRKKQEAVFLEHEGTQYANRYGVPHWIGEFGAVYCGPRSEVPARLRALDDQIEIFNNYERHWTIWTYKDMGVMGWVTVDPESEYAGHIADILKKKKELRTDHWLSLFMPATKTERHMRTLANHIRDVLGDPDIDANSNIKYLRQSALCDYVGCLMQPMMAKLFRTMSEKRMDDMLKSFSLERCRKNEGLLAILQRRLQQK
jgi:endoglucanase